jgi:tetraacyldisaccharide 4'-kinase
MMRAPAFWWQPKPSAAALALWPAAAIYGRAAAYRLEQPPEAVAPVPVICVGNFTVGGAGKTPTAIALARLALAHGLRPGLLVRGYGGSEKGPLMVDAKGHTAAQVGDEALLLAAAAPTVVSASRPAGAARLVAEGCDLIVMDDGFQNPSLAKDLSLLVVDAGIGFGNGLMLPAGPLRAPVQTQVARAGGLVILGDGPNAEPMVRLAARAGKPAIRGRLAAQRPAFWRNRPILAYAGIGRPEKFFATLAECDAPVRAQVPFPDHHVYTIADADYLLRRAEREELRLVTTAKDLARLRGAEGLMGTLRDKSEAFDVVLDFENPDQVVRMIEATVTRVLVRQEGGRPPQRRR